MGKSTELYKICWSLEHGEITSNEAHEQILCLFGVIQRSEQFCECNNPKGEGNQAKCGNCGYTFKTY